MEETGSNITIDQLKEYVWKTLKSGKVVVVREKFPELYESEQQWLRAAQMLSGIDLDSGIRLKQAFVSLYMSLDFLSPGNLTNFLKTRMLDDTNKLSKCVQIARLYLEYDDAVNAEAFINKDSFLVTNSNQEVLNLQYKVCYVRILDLKRKFLEAALRYYGISQILSNAKLGTSCSWLWSWSST
uniref:PSMD12/CSN4-like N-terminal domain-containing protein n=1 Tax=Aegilops tauschii subsp. strangulata TaxID=200361 RepID=A0A453N3W2_AEGTS